MLDMVPAFAVDDETDERLADMVKWDKFSLRAAASGVQSPDLFDLCCGELCGSNRLAFDRCSPKHTIGMQLILTARHPFEIDGSIVDNDAVLVIGFVSGGRRAMKCRTDQMVHLDVSALALDRKDDGEVSIFVRAWAQYASRPGARARRNPFHSSQVAHLIDVFIANHVAPVLSAY